MRRKVINKKIVSAMTIGITAMMTLQMPFTAYASGDVEVPPTPEPDSQRESNQSEQESYQPVTESAQEAADDAIDSIGDIPSSEEASQPGGEAASSEEGGQAGEQQTGSEESATDNAIAKSEKAADAIIEGADASDHEGVADLIDAAKAVAEDSVDAEGKEISSAINEMDNASDKIEDVKSDLKEAEEANKSAESIHKKVKEEVKEAADSYIAAAEQAGFIEEDVTEAEGNANNLVETIQKAENKEAAEEAYKELEDLVEQTKKDLETRKLLYDKLAKEYEDAVAELEKAREALEEAEAKFENKINNAENLTDSAREDVASAQQKVENLDKALDVVTNKLSQEKSANELKDTCGDNWKDKFKKIDENRRIMKQVVANYYLPEVLGLKIVGEINIDSEEECPSLKGVDGQEYNYSVVTFRYIDENGKEQEGKKYFNWDSLTRTSLTDSKKFRTTAGEGIVIFEKSEEEVMCNAIIKAYYEKNDKSVLKENVRWNNFLAGKFDIYKYVDDDGNTQYILADEMQKSEDKDSIVKDNNGNIISYGGKDLTKIIQNKNSLLHDGNCLIIASDNKVNKYINPGNTEVFKDVIMQNGEYRLPAKTIDKIISDSKALNEFINGKSSDKDSAGLLKDYIQYKEATKEAKEAADEAVVQVDKLSEALSDIKSQAAANQRSLKAVDVLGTNDIASYYKLDVSEEEAERLNNLSVADLIKELNRRKADADTKVSEAEKKVSEIETKFGDAQDELQKTIERLTDESEGGGQETEPDPDDNNQPGGGNGEGGDGGNGPEVEPGNDDGGNAGDEGGNSGNGGNSGGSSSGSRRGGGDSGSSDNADDGAQINPFSAGGNTAEVLQNQNIDGAGSAHYDISDAATPLSDNAGARYNAAQSIGGAGDEAAAPVAGEEIVNTANGAEAPIAEAQITNATNIEDEGVALADTAGDLAGTENEKPAKMSLWWLIVIAVFGATGRAMYEKYLAKKKQEADDQD